VLNATRIHTNIHMFSGLYEGMMFFSVGYQGIILLCSSLSKMVILLILLLILILLFSYFYLSYLTY